MAQELKTTERRAPSKLDGGEPTRSRPVFVPRTDIYETEDNVVVLVDMPGVASEVSTSRSRSGRWRFGATRRTNSTTTIAKSMPNTARAIMSASSPSPKISIGTVSRHRRRTASCGWSCRRSRRQRRERSS